MTTYNVVKMFPYGVNFEDDENLRRVFRRGEVDNYYMLSILDDRLKDTQWPFWNGLHILCTVGDHGVNKLLVTFTNPHNKTTHVEYKWRTIAELPTIIKMVVWMVKDELECLYDGLEMMKELGI